MPIYENGLSAAQINAGFRPRVAGEFLLTDYGKPNVITGDWTTVLNTAQAAMFAAGGGNLYWPLGSNLVAGQILLPNDGNLIPPPKQVPITWIGVGGHFNGQNSLGSGGTRVVLTYQGAGTTNDAKILTRGLGVFRCEGIVFQDTTTSSSTPFLYTTLTTLKVKDCAFLGATATTSCAQDAIIGGGTLKYPTLPVSGNGYGDADAPFQGYGTVIEGNYFNNIRRAFYGRSYCNQVVIRDNFMDKGCGSNLTGGACVEFDGSLTTTHPGDYCQSNVIVDNYFEQVGYYYIIKLIKAAQTKIAFNGSEDTGVNMVSFVRYEGVTVSAVDYPATGNVLIANEVDTYPSFTADTLSKKLSANNTLIAGQSFNEGTVFQDKVTIGANLFVAPISGSTFTLSDTDTSPNTLLTISGSLRQWAIKGPLFIDGNSGGAGSTYLTVGNHSTASDALINLDPPTGQAARINWRLNNADQWWLYNAGSAILFLRDQVNGKMHMTFTAGAGTGGTTEINSALKVDGNLGFYGTTPAAKGTVTGAKSSNAALGSLLTILAGYGILTDSSTT